MSEGGVLKGAEVPGVTCTAQCCFDIAARERSPVAPIFATGPCPFVVTGRCTTAAVPSRLLSGRGCTSILYQVLAGRARLNLHSLNGVVPSSPAYSPNSGIRMSAELKAWSDQKFDTRYIERQAGTDWGGGTNVGRKGAGGVVKAKERRRERDIS